VDTLVRGGLGECPRQDTLTIGNIIISLFVGCGHVRPEVLYSVTGLAVPSPDAADAEAVARADSARLFALRAADVQPGFALDQATAVALAQICQRLDGLPLAIAASSSIPQATTSRTPAKTWPAAALSRSSASTEARCRVAASPSMATNPPSRGETAAG
jgi:hypothetical protein